MIHSCSSRNVKKYFITCMTKNTIIIAVWMTILTTNMFKKMIRCRDFVFEQIYFVWKVRIGIAMTIHKWTLMKKKYLEPKSFSWNFCVTRFFQIPNKKYVSCDIKQKNILKTFHFHWDVYVYRVYNISIVLAWIKYFQYFDRVWDVHSVPSMIRRWYKLRWVYVSFRCNCCSVQLK